MKLYYHSYWVGLQIGSTLGPAIWSMSGNHGDQWLYGLVLLNDAVQGGAQLQLVFEGVIGDGGSGDIAIDDVALQSGDTCRRAGSNGGERI